MSDLHLELDARLAAEAGTSRRPVGNLNFYLSPPRPTADVLVLAGDIHSGAQGIDWVARNFSIPAVLIAGNRECYGHELFRVIAINRQKAQATKGKAIFLERASWEFASASGERARFIGTTLWTDFRLYRTPEASMEIARERLEDFHLIKLERGYKLRSLDPGDIIRLNSASVTFLRQELSRPFDGATIVVTHHAPSPRSIPPKFQHDPLNPAFASDLEDLIHDHAPTLWVHGHMHDSVDYRIDRTRVICNPRGYFPDHLNPEFDPSLVVELLG